jgi:DNA mismatch repair protein MutS2
MALAGMHCPCRGDTVIGAISDILLDIGDQQSIEESLSTFSAHIANVKMILDNARPGTLVLIDELGAGTDPLEGAALGLAILRRLNDSGALSVVTSHFTEFKLAAESNPGMQNASVEWDSVNLKPTYRLITGRPGRSNAFLVAERLGLDSEILEEAKGNLGQDILQLEDIIADLEESSQKAREEALLAARERQLAESLRKQYESKLETQEKQRRDLLNEAKQEARSIVSRARLEFEKAVKEFREKQRLTGKELTSQIGEIRERFRSASHDLGPETVAPLEGEPLRPEDAVPGTTVYVTGFRDAATVVEAPGPGEPSVLVRIGSLSLRAPMEDLRIPTKTLPNKTEPRPESSRIAMEKAQSVSGELDLRGMTSDEALLVLDKYLDDAILAGLSQVRVIHGKGTGALRRAVSLYLKDHRYVAESRLGEASQGGSGVTIARLRSH